MRDRRVNWGVALCGALAIALSRGLSAHRQCPGTGSTTSGPSLEEYLQQVGPEGTVIGHGQLKIGGRAVNCGKRPTVLNPVIFHSWGCAFPGFLILNTKKLDGLPTPVKLYLYFHECGHQFVGADEVEGRFLRR